MRKYSRLLTGATTLVLSMSLVACGSLSSSTGSVEVVNAVAQNKDYNSSDEITVVTREEGSGTRSAFNNKFGLIKKDGDTEIDLTYSEAVVADSAGVISRVLTDGNAIGYISMSDLDSSVKAISIDEIPATAINIYEEIYKAYRPFVMLSQNGPNRVVNDFKRFVVSEQGQEIIATKYIKVVGSARVYKGGGLNGKITIGGSASVAPIMKEIAEEYNKLNPNVEITFEVNDSSTGIQGVIDKNYDIGMSSRELYEVEDAQVNSREIAYDGLVIIVNKNNPIRDLYSEDIQKIFSGEITSWEFE